MADPAAAHAAVRQRLETQQSTLSTHAKRLLGLKDRARALDVKRLLDRTTADIASLETLAAVLSPDALARRIEARLHFADIEFETHKVNWDLKGDQLEVAINSASNVPDSRRTARSAGSWFTQVGFDLGFQQQAAADTCGGGGAPGAVDSASRTSATSRRAGGGSGVPNELDDAAQAAISGHRSGTVVEGRTLVIEAKDGNPYFNFTKVFPMSRTRQLIRHFERKKFLLTIYQVFNPSENDLGLKGTPNESKIDINSGKGMGYMLSFFSGEKVSRTAIGVAQVPLIGLLHHSEITLEKCPIMDIKNPRRVVGPQAYLDVSLRIQVPLISTETEIVHERIMQLALDDNMPNAVFVPAGLIPKTENPVKRGSTTAPVAQPQQQARTTPTTPTTNQIPTSPSPVQNVAPITLAQPVSEPQDPIPTTEDSSQQEEDVLSKLDNNDEFEEANQLVNSVKEEIGLNQVGTSTTGVEVALDESLDDDDLLDQLKNDMNELNEIQRQAENFEQDLMNDEEDGEDYDIQEEETELSDEDVDALLSKLQMEIESSDSGSNAKASKQDNPFHVIDNHKEKSIEEVIAEAEQAVQDALGGKHPAANGLSAKQQEEEELNAILNSLVGEDGAPKKKIKPSTTPTPRPIAHQQQPQQRLSSTTQAAHVKRKPVNFSSSQSNSARNSTATNTNTNAATNDSLDQEAVLESYRHELFNPNVIVSNSILEREIQRATVLIESQQPLAPQVVESYKGSPLAGTKDEIRLYLTSVQARMDAIVAMVQNGKLSPEQYYHLLKSSNQRIREMALYFRRANNKPLAMEALSRSKLMQQEMEELTSEAGISG